MEAAFNRASPHKKTTPIADQRVYGNDKEYAYPVRTCHKNTSMPADLPMMHSSDPPANKYTAEIKKRFT